MSRGERIFALNAQTLQVELTFESASQAARKLKVTRQAISYAIKTGTRCKKYKIVSESNLANFI